MRRLARKPLALARRKILQQFLMFERLGVHVTPVHFYSTIPDTRDLVPETWQRHSDLVGIDMREDGQLALLEHFYDSFHHEYDRMPRKPTVSGTYYTDNDSFREVDGEILYCFVRSLRPRAIIEVGSGKSTLVISQALRRNQQDGAHCNYTVIDPYWDASIISDVMEGPHLITTKVEQVSLDTFDSLGANDILFLDTSHSLRTGGDVWFEVLEVMPRLKPGVVVHIHDIFLPGEYPEEWLKRKFWFWNEQYVLQAFLAYNDSFKVEWAGNYMRLRHPEELKRSFRSFVSGETMPGSFWIRRVK